MPNRAPDPASAGAATAWQRRIVLSCLIAFALAACERKVPPEVAERLALTATTFEVLPGWGEDTVGEALPALLRSCARIEALPDERALGPDGGALAGTVADWRAPCAALAGVAPDDDVALRSAIESRFVPFRARSGERGSGLVTGYYEAELEGALFPGGAYQVPIYARPHDLVSADLGMFAPDLRGKSVVGRVEDGRLVPYPTRGDIERGALGGRNLELVWASDPVDVFFLHVQGSGRVRFPDGGERRIGYAISNGRDFTAIGRALIDEGKIPRDQASMQGIRDWLRAHPQEAEEIMERNARYIFFRWIEGDGPIGAEGVALTPGRSLAVDPSVLPFGVPVFLDTTWPGTDQPLRRLMVAQDTGAAIRGPLRADFFWGAGEPALAQAGRMKQDGRFYILLPKTVAERRAPTS